MNAHSRNFKMSSIAFGVPLALILSLCVKSAVGVLFEREDSAVQRRSDAGFERSDRREYLLASNAKSEVVLLEEEEERGRPMGEVNVLRVRVLGVDGKELADWLSPLVGRHVQDNVGRFTFGSATPALLGDSRYSACSIGEADGWAVWAPDFETVALLRGSNLEHRVVVSYDADGAEAVAMIGAFTQDDSGTAVVGWARVNDNGSKLVLEHMEFAPVGQIPDKSRVIPRIEATMETLFGDGSRLVRVVGTGGRGRGVLALQLLELNRSEANKWVLMLADWSASRLDMIAQDFDVQDVVSMSMCGDEIAIAQSSGSVTIAAFSDDGTSLESVSHLILPTRIRYVRLDPNRLVVSPLSRDPLVLTAYR